MSRKLTNGWQLLALCALGLVLMCGAILLYRPGAAGIHLALRATADAAWALPRPLSPRADISRGGLIGRSLPR